MKKKLRVISMLLAVLMLLPAGIFPVSAERAEYGNMDFEALDAGSAPLPSDGFAALPETSSVNEEAENHFLRIPFVGAYERDSETGKETVSGNCDRALQINHAALNSGKGFTVAVDYRPHHNGGANATVEMQFVKYTFTLANGTVKEDAGTQLSLFRINLNDGSLVGCGTVVSGAVGMKPDEWNRLMLTYHPENGWYEIYINGVLYSRMDAPKMMVGTQPFMNCKDVRIGANQLVIAKCGKNADAYTAEAGETTNYIDVDNIRIYESQEACVILDGKETFVNLDIGADFSKAEKKLVYAEVTHPGQKPFYTTETSFPVEDGTVINTRYVGLDSIRDDGETLRAAGIYGLRYLTAINKTDYEGLKSDERIKSVKLGTAILPADLLNGAELTAETLAQTEYLDVPVNEGAWYNYKVRYCHTFAGSIVGIKETNACRSFVGVGYVKVTLADGSVITVLAESGRESAAKATMSFAVYKELMQNKELDMEAKENVTPYLDRAMEEMKGLNVLAFGDSLFGGTGGYPQRTQWVNKLGLDFGWNLTNLGTSSMTVSLTKYNNDKAHGNKNSMYDWLFNNKNDFRWGSTSKHQSPHPFFSCGDISGDPNDVDLIILEGGCNDYGTAISAPLGDVDSRDPGTFLGAWNLITEKLLADYPNAKIVFLTTWRLGAQKRENDTLTSIEFSESVITLYEEKYADNDRIALIDAGNPEVSGVDMRNATWRDEYSTDSYHLKDTGMALMASNMIPLLWDILNK